MNSPTIIAETNEYWVINKPAGFTVEAPGPGPTILDWLVDTKKLDKNGWSADSRYGVVHRLDTDTTGILTWAKNPQAQEKLKLAWQGRVVQKTYLGLAVGELLEAGTVDVPIKRDNQKDRQAVSLLPDPKARPAITNYQRLAMAEVGGHKVSFFEAHPITGRTHQIRVHLKYLGHPIIGDKLYGDKAAGEIAKKLGLTRHFLHAWKICLPDKNCYEAPLPEDLSAITEKLDLNLLD